DQREDLVGLDEALRHLDRFLGLVAVIDRIQLELAALDAARLVDLGESGGDALTHAETERRGRAFQRRGLAEDDLVGANAGIGGEAGSGKRQRGQRAGPENRSHRGVSSRLTCRIIWTMAALLGRITEYFKIVGLN